MGCGDGFVGSNGHDTLLAQDLGDFADADEEKYRQDEADMPERWCEVGGGVRRPRVGDFGWRLRDEDTTSGSSWDMLEALWKRVEGTWTTREQYYMTGESGLEGGGVHELQSVQVQDLDSRIWAGGFISWAGWTQALQSCDRVSYRRQHWK